MPYKDKDKAHSWFRERYQHNREWLQRHKVEKGCADCGYNKHHAGLEFDHIEVRLRGTVSSQVGKSLKCLQEEVDRCEVVCGTCHNIRTWKRKNAPVD